jgi:hypothetical protein
VSRANDKWELPAALRVTEEMLPAIEAAQRELAARINSPFARLSPQEQERAQAARLVTELTEQLKHVEHRLGRVFTRAGAENFDELRATQGALWKRLAEAHASTGRFDEAARYETDRTLKAEYLRTWRAVWRDDAHACSCPPHRGSGRNANLEVPTVYVKRDVWSVRHGRVVPLVACSKCRCLNVQPLPPALAEQRAARARAHELAAGLSPAEAAARLRAAGHTTETLSK